MRIPVKFLLCFLSSLLFVVAGFGQETWGTIRGTVTDPSGAAIPGASVELSGALVPRAYTASTEANGVFQFQRVPVGTGYLITAGAAGFRTARASGINVELGKATTLELKLEVGLVTESVSVTANTVMVDTQSSASAVTVDKSFFDQLPKGRSFYDLIAIAPGARNETKTGGFEVDGASGAENTYYIDGMEVTNIQQGYLSTQNRVPIDMVQQLEVKNGVMDAQYGGAMGGVVNAVINSGSNQFHGKAGFYFNNAALQARDRPALRLDPWFENKAQEFQNPYGIDQFTTWNPIFDVGGPLLKSKLFFFAAFMPTTTNTTRKVDFNLTTPYTYKTASYDQHSVQHYTAAKVDYAPFSKLRMNLGWIWNPNYNQGYLPVKGGTDSIGTPWAGLANYSAGNILTGSIDYLASNRLILSFRGGYTYSNYTDNYNLPSYTAIYYSGTSTTLPPSNLQGPNGWIQQPTAFTAYNKFPRINMSADASYTFNWFGQHNLKGGWQTNRLSNSVATSSYANGYYRYYWGLSYTCVTSQCSGKQTGAYGYYRYRVLGTYGDASSDNQGIFIQDSWKVSKRLTLNLGLRTEREFLPSFSYAGSTAAPPIEFSWPQKMSPRIGFAYDPTGTGKQRIYGSFGYFYDVMKYEMPRGSFGGDVWLEWYYTLDNPSVVTANGGLPADPGKLAGKFLEKVNWRIPSNDPTAGLIDPNLKPMKNRMFDIGYDFSIGPMLVASARYTNRRLIRTIEDIGYESDAGEVYVIGNPGFGYVASRANWDKWMGPNIPTTYKAVRDYDALEFRLDKRFSKSYQFSASYTWSRLWGNYSGLASSDENGRTSPNVNRYFDMPWVGRDQTGAIANGALATDRPHTVKFFGSYAYNSKMGTTTLSPIIGLYSGTPITTEVPVVSTTPMFPFGRGDMGRTPFYHNFDLSLNHEFKPFKAHEAMKVRLEFAVFNLFNNSTITDRFKTILHSSDGQLVFLDKNGNPDYAAVFKGFDTRALMTAQGDRVDPQYGQTNAFQGPRSARLQVAFYF